MTVVAHREIQAVDALNGFRKWTSVALGTFRRFGENRATLVSAGVTYFLLLALFPAVTAFVSVYGLFADGTTISKNLSVLVTVVPAGGLQIINDQLTRLTEQGSPTLGLALFISLAIALWSASSGVKSLFEALNIAYEVRESRNFFLLNGLALAFTLLGVVVAGLVLAIVVAMPIVFGVVGLGKGFEWLIQAAGYALLIAVLLVGIAALYKFGPSLSGAKWRWISPGAGLAIVVIGTESGLFSWYASNFAHFDKTYGSLGALIGFLFWMWVANTALIAGAELNAEIDRDSGKGSPPDALRNKPVGAQAPSPSIGQPSSRLPLPLRRRASPVSLLVSVLMISVLVQRATRSGKATGAS